jgi:dienelactone hydrolase
LISEGGVWLSIERFRWAMGAVAAALLAAVVLAPSARADFPSLYGGDVSCAAQAANGNVRLCGGETTTWDGKTQIDVNVVLPPAPTGDDGPYPLIGVFHGWGGHKIGLEDARVQDWAESGYAVFSISDRGWGESCGGQDPDRLTEPEACAAGYNHLLDTRYEVRDAQYLISILADEGVAEPKKIGATGVSYGGGMSLALAALRNRTMLPDGSLVAWKSPTGTAMELAAAVPQWPWSDLAYSLMPNGSTLDYATDSPYRGPDGSAPIGVEKASYVTGLYGLGLASSNYAPPGTDPGADLTTWYGLINAGEPYDSNPLANSIIAEITAHHSSYYIDHSQAPAPLLIQSGWNDDLFPVDEAVRFYNRTRSQYPADPISLFLIDDGHARSQNKPADEALFLARENAWFDHYLQGVGAAPSSSAEALTTTCGGPSEGPFEAADWQSLSPGEIRFGGEAAQTVLPAAGDPSIGAAFDPIAGSGACATASGADQAGAANYRLSVPAPGFTLLGSPTVIADLGTVNADSALAARLLDVGPDGKERLLARGLLRPGSGGEDVVFQLHPQGYRFAGGDTVKLELLPSDPPYSRPSNMQAPITVSNLELRLPVREQPGDLGGLVQTPAAPGRVAKHSTSGVAAVPPGAAGVAGRLRATRKAVRVPLRCQGGSCSGKLTLKLGRRALASGIYAIPVGRARLTLSLTKAGRRALANKRRAGKRGLRIKLHLEDAGHPAPFDLTRRLRLR